MEYTGYGLTLSYGTTPTAFTKVMEVLETPKISSPEVSIKGVNDTANLTQPSSQPDYGNLKVSIPHTKANNQLIRGWQAAGSRLVQPFVLTATNGTETTTETYNGWSKEFDSFGGQMTADKMLLSILTIRISGVPTVA